jgi:hypothetical protein
MIMKKKMQNLKRCAFGIFILAAAFAVCLFFPASISRANQDGAINLIGDNGLCIVDGDFTKIFKPGDTIEVSRFNKQYGAGYVQDVFESYMIVIVETRQNDYFLKEGDIVHKPLPKEIKKMKMLSAQIKPKSEEENVSADIVGTAEKQGSIVVSDSVDVAETDVVAPKSGEDVQSILFDRARTGGVVSSDEKSEKQGKIIKSDSASEDTASKDTAPESSHKETKADSRRRKQAIEKEQ